MSLRDGQDHKLARRYDLKITLCKNSITHYIKWDSGKYGDIKEYKPCLNSFTTETWKYSFTMSEFESWSFENFKLNEVKKGIYSISFKCLNIATFNFTENFMEALEEHFISLDIGFSKADSCNNAELIRGGKLKRYDYEPKYYTVSYNDDWFIGLPEAKREIYWKMTDVLWKDWNRNIPEHKYYSYNDIMYDAMFKKKSIKDLEEILQAIIEENMSGDDSLLRNNGKTAKILFELGKKL